MKMILENTFKKRKITRKTRGVRKEESSMHQTGHGEWGLGVWLWLRCWWLCEEISVYCWHDQKRTVRIHFRVKAHRVWCMISSAMSSGFNFSFSRSQFESSTRACSVAVGLNCRSDFLCCCSIPSVGGTFSDLSIYSTSVTELFFCMAIIKSLKTMLLCSFHF